MTETRNTKQAVGVAIGAVLVATGLSWIVRATGLIPDFVFEWASRLTPGLLVIALGAVIIVVASKGRMPVTGTRLYRSVSDRWLGGVIGGLGRYIGVDPTVLRIAFILLAVLGFGPIVIVYILMWVLVPEEPAAAAPPPWTPPAPPTGAPASAPADAPSAGSPAADEAPPASTPEA